MSWPAFTTFPGLKDSLIRFLLARLYFASSSTIARRERKHLSILFLDRSLLPLASAVSQLPGRHRPAYRHFTATAECSISTSLPNCASPPNRDPGTQTVAGRKTKSKQDSYVRQHRMFPQATSSLLAIVVPSQPERIPISSNSGQTTARPAGRRHTGQTSPHWSERRRRWSIRRRRLLGHHC